MAILFRKNKGFTLMELLVVIAVIALLAAILLPALANPAGKAVVPTNGMKITTDTTLAPGTYYMDNGVEIAADGVTLDGGGALLIGTDFKNTAVRAAGRKNITIKNITAVRYYHGIRLEDCRDVTVQDNRLTCTAEIEAGKSWLNIFIPADKAYGAGIMFIKVRGGKIANNYLEHQQNGICMYSCTGVTVEKNDTSYQSGWGIHLYDSSDNIIQDNLSDFCNRVHFRSRGDYVGADAAGILLVHNSCRNKILRNFFRAGGDGIFVAGGKGPCNDNLFERNDCSLSPNNAIEAVGCEGNIFRKNKASKSNYGFWLGGSWRNHLIENDVVDNRFSGISIDHGNMNTISKNLIKGNQHGVMLWSNNPRQAIKDAPPGRGDSYGYVIADNDFQSNRVGIYSVTTGKGDARCYKYTVTGNKFTDCRVGIVFERTNDSKIEGNSMCGNAVENIRQIDCTGNIVTNNTVVEPPTGNPEARVLPREVPR